MSVRDGRVRVRPPMLVYPDDDAAEVEGRAVRGSGIRRPLPGDEFWETACSVRVLSMGLALTLTVMLATVSVSRIRNGTRAIEVETLETERLIGSIVKHRDLTVHVAAVPKVHMNIGNSRLDAEHAANRHDDADSSDSVPTRVPADQADGHDEIASSGASDSEAVDAAVASKVKLVRDAAMDGDDAAAETTAAAAAKGKKKRRVKPEAHTIEPEQTSAPPTETPEPTDPPEPTPPPLTLDRFGRIPGLADDSPAVKEARQRQKELAEQGPTAAAKRTRAPRATPGRPAYPGRRTRAPKRPPPPNDVIGKTGDINEKLLERMREAAAKNDEQRDPPLTKDRPTTDDGKPKWRIGLVTLNAKHVQKVNIRSGGVNKRPDWMHGNSYRNKYEYCKRWGYDLIVEDNSIVDRSRDVAWSKIPIFKKWLPQYDYLMWMDMDAFFMRLDIPLEYLIRDEERELVIAKDFNGLNFGVFILRNRPWSFELLNMMWKAPRHWWEPWQEQSALIKLTEKKYVGKARAEEINSHIQVTRQRDMNSYPQQFSYGSWEAHYQDGDFIVHFPNCKAIPACRTIIDRYYRASCMFNDVSSEIGKVPQKYYPEGANVDWDSVDDEAKKEKEKDDDVEDDSSKDSAPVRVKRSTQAPTPKPTMRRVPAPDDEEEEEEEETTAPPKKQKKATGKAKSPKPTAASSDEDGSEDAAATSSPRKPTSSDAEEETPKKKKKKTNAKGSKAGGKAAKAGQEGDTWEEEDSS